jgi:hypothetical protein
MGACGPAITRRRRRARMQAPASQARPPPQDWTFSPRGGSRVSAVLCVCVCTCALLRCVTQAALGVDGRPGEDPHLGYIWTPRARIYRAP